MEAWLAALTKSLTLRNGKPESLMLPSGKPDASEWKASCSCFGMESLMLNASEWKG
jgi:hypothetical protein